MTDISKEAVDVVANVLRVTNEHYIATLLTTLRAAPTGHWKDACRESNGPGICDEPCSKCLRTIGERANG